MSQIGYISDYEKKTKALSKKKDAVLSFDSNNGINTRDLKHHLLVLGTTGAGKTRSVILPCIMNLLKKGHCGLIIDIKGNLREQVWALAKSTGRLADIIEFGNSPTATPLNLIKNSSSAEVNSLIKSLTMESFSGESHNKDFHARGIRQSTECFNFLRILEEHGFVESPTLASIENLIVNPRGASDLYEAFKQKIYNHKDKKHKKFVYPIESNSFHLFKYREKEKESRNGSSTYHDQLNYVLEGQRTVFKELLEVKGIMSGFAASGANGLDMKEMLKQNKIMIVRFEPGSGSIGISMARKIIEEFYKSIYELGVKEAEKRPTFICVDEFQDVAVLDDSKFSDVAFISQAREFNTSCIASTQSISALTCRGNNPSSVDAYVSNCNTRIIFYSDDPKTQEIVARYKFPLDLINLEKRTAFVAQYNSDITQHSRSIESFAHCFKSTNKILEQNIEEIDITNKYQSITDDTECIADIVARIKHNEKLHKGAKEKKGQGSVFTKTKQINGKQRNLFDIIKEETMMEKTSKKQKSISQKNKEEDIVSQTKYEEYFEEHGIPIGWYPLLTKGIDFIVQSRVNFEINSFKIRNHALYICSDQAKEGTIFAAILTEVNSLLENTKYVCPVCSEYLKKEEYMQLSKHDGDVFLCHNCLELYGITYSNEKVNEEDEEDVYFENHH